MSVENTSITPNPVEIPASQTLLTEYQRLIGEQNGNKPPSKPSDELIVFETSLRNCLVGLKSSGSGNSVYGEIEMEPTLQKLDFLRRHTRYSGSAKDTIINWVKENAPTKAREMYLMFVERSDPRSKVYAHPARDSSGRDVHYTS